MDGGSEVGDLTEGTQAGWPIGVTAGHQGVVAQPGHRSANALLQGAEVGRVVNDVECSEIGGVQGAGRSVLTDLDDHCVCRAEDRLRPGLESRLGGRPRRRRRPAGRTGEVIGDEGECAMSDRITAERRLDDIGVHGDGVATSGCVERR